MPNHIFDVDGHSVVFGLDWELLDGDRKEAKEAAEKAKTHRADLQVRHQSGNTVVYGFLSKETLSQKPGKKPLLSAGVLFATVPDVAENAVWAWIETQSQSAQMLVLENGVPTSSEFVGSIAEVNQRLDRLQRESGKTYQVYGNHTKAYPDAIHMSLSDMVECGNLQQATLVGAKRGGGGLVGLVLLILILAGGGVGVKYYMDEQERKRLEELERQRVDPVKLYKEAVQQALPQAGVPSPKAEPLFLGGWLSQETLIAGWLLNSVECVPESCTYVWSINGGNNQTLVEALEGKHTYHYSVDGKEVKYSVTMQGTPPLLNIDTLPKTSDFMLKTGSMFQDLRLGGMNVTLEVPSIFAEVPGVNMAGVPSPIKHAKVTINGDVAQLKELVNTLPENVTVKRLLVTLPNSDPKFVLEGAYYVKD